MKITGYALRAYYSQYSYQFTIFKILLRPYTHRIIFFLLNAIYNNILFKITTRF